LRVQPVDDLPRLLGKAPGAVTLVGIDDVQQVCGTRASLPAWVWPCRCSPRDTPAASLPNTMWAPSSSASAGPARSAHRPWGPAGDERNTSIRHNIRFQMRLKRFSRFGVRSCFYHQRAPMRENPRHLTGEHVR
jgi:hypothetical protein